MANGLRYIFLGIFLISWAFSARAEDSPGIRRYYDPLDRLAGSSVILSRNKESATLQAIKFPFSENDYAGRMAKLAGCFWDPSASRELNTLTGPYAEKMYDALGVFAELQNRIAPEFKNRQVSENYQLLAPMLSGMNVHYVAEGGKRGLWQLDVVTATRYGLTVTDLRDDRDDPVLAASAAAAYLKDLQSQFRSPEAVLWAYVSSPAEVRRAFVRAESADPKKVVAFLPEYVKPAVSVFSAWAFIWNYTDRDNLPVFTPAVFLPYENALLSEKTHLGQISEMMEISLATLKELNPALKRQLAGPQETIHLPQGYASRFLAIAPLVAKYKDSLYLRAEPARTVLPNVQASAQQTATPLSSTVKKYHKVRSGESLSQIAQKYHVSVSSLKKWNHLSSSHIRAGQKIVVQTTTQSVIADREDRTVRENVKIEGGDLSGDKDDSSPQPAPKESATDPTLQAKTPAETKTVTTVPKPKTPAWTYYTVRSGDTLSSIGRKYGVVYTKIKEWNGLRSDNLQVGQKLKIKK